MSLTSLRTNGLNMDHMISNYVHILNDAQLCYIGWKKFTK